MAEGSSPGGGSSLLGVGGGRGPAATTGRFETVTRLEPQDVPRGVTFRSFLIGVLLVTVMSAYAPYQHVIGGTWLEGGYMPLMGFLGIGLLLVINALFTRYAPDRRFSGTEYAVVLAMILCAAGVINIGLYRQLPGNLTGLWHVANENADWKRVLAEMDLPHWIFPTLEGETVEQRSADTVIQYYTGRTPLDDRGWLSQWSAVPWEAWRTPAMAWAAFCLCLWGACLCLVLIFRRQWVENERLAFPIAHVYLSLIEPPEPGRAFNRIVRSRSLWIACAVVAGIKIFNGLSTYDPKHFPEIPLDYNFTTTLFANAPWSYTDWGFKEQRLNFTLIAVCLFMTTKVSFSIWFFYILLQVARMSIGGAYQREITGGMATDQTLGAILAYGLAAAWVARQHLAVVVAQMLRGARAGEPQGRYLPYLLVGWALVAFYAGMVIWLNLAGATVLGSAFIAFWLLTCLTVLARLIAETGFAFFVFSISMSRWFVYGLQDLPKALAFRTTLPTYFHSNLLGGVFLQDLGHSFAPHAANSLRIADAAGFERTSTWRRAWPVIACVVVAIAIGYVLAGAGMLHMEYNHAVTLDQRQAEINNWGAIGMPRWYVLGPTADFAPPREGPAETHSRSGHFAFGAAVTAACSVLRLRYDWWPLHPVGFILVYGWGISAVWLSIFIGWLLKVTVVKFGGASGIRAIRPFMIGLIVGDATAGLFWVGVSLIRLSIGLEYYAI